LCQEIPQVFRCIVEQHVLAHELVLTPRAIRAIRSGLPEGVAAAVIEFLTGVLVENPHRVGRRSRGAAERLYQLISPVRSRFAVDGIGAACYGSMARPLGRPVSSAAAPPYGTTSPKRYVPIVPAAQPCWLLKPCTTSGGRSHW
jgi:hypothetical protein